MVISLHVQHPLQLSALRTLLIGCDLIGFNWMLIKTEVTWCTSYRRFSQLSISSVLIAGVDVHPVCYLFIDSDLGAAARLKTVARCFTTPPFLSLCHWQLFPSITGCLSICYSTFETSYWSGYRPIFISSSILCSMLQLSGVPASTLWPHHWCPCSSPHAAFTTTGWL